ncbi:PIR protein [Plasmodium vivax]|nr:PIR protein [Plasmodium vivax]
MELFLKGTSTYKLYKKFFREDIYNEETSACKYHKSKFSGNDQLHNLCKMYEKNLEDLLNSTEVEFDSNQHCRYLTFWINDEIRKVFNSPNIGKYNRNSVLRVFPSVSHMVDVNSSKNKCEYSYKSYITPEMWKEWKDLYDYIMNEDKIKIKINSDIELCKKYSTYHTYISNIYRKYKNECCTGNIGNCPDDHLKLNDCCTRADILIKLKCRESMEDLVSSSETGEYSILMQGRAGGAESDEEEGRGELDGKDGRGGSVKEKGSVPVESHRSQAVPEENPESRAGPEIIKIAEGSMGEVTIVPGIVIPSESKLNKNVSTIGATFAGTSLFLVMMYKYTPLGSWVNTKILGKNKLMDNMKRNHYELLLNDVQNGDMSLNDTTYSISYNSEAK